MKKFLRICKSVGRWLAMIFEDQNGVPSSKRIQSFVLFGFGFYLAVMGLNWELVAVVFGAALGLQGVTSWNK